jgi:hypothetical protein
MPWKINKLKNSCFSFKLSKCIGVFG